MQTNTYRQDFQVKNKFLSSLLTLVMHFILNVMKTWHSMKCPIDIITFNCIYSARKTPKAKNIFTNRSNWRWSHELVQTVIAHLQFPLIRIIYFQRRLYALNLSVVPNKRRNDHSDNIFNMKQVYGSLRTYCLKFVSLVWLEMVHLTTSVLTSSRGSFLWSNLKIKRKYKEQIQ